MDSGATPRHSRRLAGLLPSTSPPPLGEIPRHSRRTMLEIDSHTMGDRLEDIPEPPPPIHVDDGEFTPTYDPSPELAELGLMISEIGTFHDRSTYSRVDSPLFTRMGGGGSGISSEWSPMVCESVCDIVCIDCLGLSPKGGGEVEGKSPANDENGAEPHSNPQ